MIQLTAPARRPADLSKLVLLLLLAVAGCRSTPESGQSGPPPVAAVDIRGNTPGQVKPTVSQVFQDHGYRLASSTPGELVFDKPGGGWNNLAYGSWMEASVWVRVKVRLLPTPELGCRLECRAYRVRDPASAMEQETPLPHAKGKPLQELLDQIAASLNRPPA